jgi:hypothetical protein
VHKDELGIQNDDFCLSSIHSSDPPVHDPAFAEPLSPEIDEAVSQTLTTAITDGLSDDPIRLYSMQMGQIPLLSREREIALARTIEVNRARFRALMLETAFVIESAVETLRRVRDGRLPFDRTVQVSSTDQLGREQIEGRLPQNLQTLEVLLEGNRQDYRLAWTSARKRFPDHGFGL